jgi:SAM-dependent methyltransferase
MTDGQRTAAQYDAMARPYAEQNTANAANAMYERPATMTLLSELDLSGKQVLEAGCGAGVLTQWLLERGAEVTALDASAEMLALARARVGGGDHVTIRQHDLHEPLGFVSEAAFDVVVASLVLHYLRDWEPLLTEFRRVLVPGGRVVFSTHHPSWDWRNHTPDDYFAKLQVSETWIRAGQPFEVTFWRRPLRDMTAAIRASGLAIEQMTEPDPLPELADCDPEAYRELTTNPFFLFFVLRAPGPDGRIC